MLYISKVPRDIVRENYITGEVQVFHFTFLKPKKSWVAITQKSIDSNRLCSTLDLVLPLMKQKPFISATSCILILPKSGEEG